MNDLISVIIPVYNTSDYIGECIESVLNQTWKQIEIVLVDDGSKDESLDICRKYAEKETCIKLIENDHKGVSATRNTGMDVASGDYFFFLDGDDCLDEDLLRELVTKMKNNNADLGASLIRKFGVCVERMVDGNKGENVGFVSGDEIIHAFCFGIIKGIGAIGGKMISRRLIENLRFEKDISSGEDTLFLYTLIQKQPNVVISEDCFYNYRFHNSNTVSKITHKKVCDTFYVYEYISRNEANAGRDGESLFWYTLLVRWIGKWLGEKRDLQEKDVRKLLKEKLRELKKDSRYALLPQKIRYKLAVACCPVNFYDEVMYDAPDCCGCGACADICPNNCIKMTIGKDGFAYPVIDSKKCTNCGLCDKVCPSKAVYGLGNQPEYYALQADDEIRKKSTSGGAFRLLAESVLESNGVVAGASLINNEVRHILVESKEELEKLIGSKYVQSNTQGIFKSVKKYLEDGITVLFSGTPCQVEALNRYLGRDYENLILVDLICNGVASPKIWKKYVGMLERMHHDRLLDFHFRDKRNGDDGHTVSALFEKGEKTWSMYSDSFCRSYFNGNNFRVQCRKCRFCTDRRDSDFTIGDFWGVEKFMPEWNDGMGTSLVLVHTPKAKEMIKTIYEKAKIVSVKESQARQPRLLYPFEQQRHIRFARFFFGKMPFHVWLKIFSK